MRHVRALRLEALEGRVLLSTAHPKAAHPVKTPLTLVGTLNVDDKASQAIANPDGSTTTTVPVAGTLGALGKVQGVWNENMDSYGDATGPDVLRLHNASGTLVLSFPNVNPGKARPFGPGTVAFQHKQKLAAGTGAYANASESGTIKVVSNSAKTVVKSLVLSSTGG